MSSRQAAQEYKQRRKEIWEEERELTRREKQREQLLPERCGGGYRYMKKEIKDDAD